MAEAVFYIIRFLLYLAVTAAGVFLILTADRRSVRLLTLAGGAALILLNGTIAKFLTICVMALLGLLLRIFIVVLVVLLLLRLVLGGWKD